MFKKLKEKLKLRAKLTALFLIVGLTPIVVISTLAYHNFSENIKTEIFLANQLFATSVENQLENYFVERKNNANVLANTQDVYQSVNVLREANWDTTDPNWQRAHVILNSVSNVVIEQFGYDYIFITNPQGKVIYSTKSEVMGANLADRDYVQKAIKGETNWSQLFFSDVINQNIMVVAAPIGSNSAKGDIIGTINLICNQTEIESHVHRNTAQLGKTADAYIVDANGLLLTNTRLSQYAHDAALSKIINTKAMELLSDEINLRNTIFKAQEQYLDYQGNPVLGSMRVVALGDMAAGLIVEIDQAEALAGLYSMRKIIIIISVLASGIIVAAGYFMALYIVRPVEDVAKLALKLAEGDFCSKIQVKTNDEIGKMTGNLNNTIDALSNVLGQVKGSSHMVAHAAEEISLGNQDLSQRTEEQASSLEELASIIEEISSSLESSSANAAEADNISKQTLTTVNKGEAVVTEMYNAMRDITVSSEEIAEITDKVNDIAFQTNLLALNAAVEAARAGEQGRGFAVVAAEVRNLAGRSADSAKEIEKLIKNSMEQVKKGNHLMDKTDNVLKEIIVNTKQTTDIVGEIAASLREQSHAAGDIRVAVEDLNQVTQQNASLVEEIASSSENMSSEAIHLANLAKQFQLQQETQLVKAYNQHQIKNSYNSESAKKTAVTQESATVDDEINFNAEDFEKF